MSDLRLERARDIAISAVERRDVSQGRGVPYGSSEDGFIPGILDLEMARLQIEKEVREWYFKMGLLCDPPRRPR